MALDQYGYPRTPANNTFLRRQLEPELESELDSDSLMVKREPREIEDHSSSSGSALSERVRRIVPKSAPDVRHDVLKRKAVYSVSDTDEVSPEPFLDFLNQLSEAAGQDPDRPLHEATCINDHHNADPSASSDLGYSALTFHSLEEAQATLDTRTKLTEVYNDDVEVVKATKERWVLLIKQALTAGYACQVDGAPPYKHSDEAQSEWIKWQEDAMRTLETLKKRTKTGPDHEELAAWRLVHEAIIIHQKGHLLSPGARGVADLRLRCSERLVAIAKAVADFPLVRVDALKAEDLHELVAIPLEYTRRKQHYLWNNVNRRHQKGLLVDAAAQVRQRQFVDAGLQLNISRKRRTDDWRQRLETAHDITNAESRTIKEEG